jgi:NAD(P)-dependent dehydrogenase (short-subunit alcohol dehydrogenase family)
MHTINKLAIVTGGGSGIGLAIAGEFVRTGIYTIIVGRDEEKLRAACAQLGSNSDCYCCDLSDLNAIPCMVDYIVQQHGHIDILVNNAGVNMKKPFTEVTDEDFQRILQTNVTAVFALSREVVKHQLAAGVKGAIINISSMASQYGIPKVIAYTASKAAIEGMTKAMATELSPQGIRINCIAPGFIATDMSAKALDADPERKAKVLGRTPMGYLGLPADVAAAALFLASDAAQYITGVILPVDGGNAIGF